MAEASSNGDTVDEREGAKVTARERLRVYCIVRAMPHSADVTLELDERHGGSRIGGFVLERNCDVDFERESRRVVQVVLPPLVY